MRRNLTSLRICIWFVWNFLDLSRAVEEHAVKAVVNLLDLVTLHTKARPADEAAQSSQLLNHLRAKVMRAAAALRQYALESNLIKIQRTLCGHAQVEDGAEDLEQVVDLGVVTQQLNWLALPDQHVEP